MRVPSQALGQPESHARLRNSPSPEVEAAAAAPAAAVGQTRMASSVISKSLAWGSQSSHSSSHIRQKKNSSRSSRSCRVLYHSLLNHGPTLPAYPCCRSSCLMAQLCLLVAVW